MIPLKLSIKCFEEFDETTCYDSNESSYISFFGNNKIKKGFAKWNMIFWCLHLPHVILQFFFLWFFTWEIQDISYYLTKIIIPLSLMNNLKSSYYSTELKFISFWQLLFHEIKPTLNLFTLAWKSVSAVISNQSTPVGISVTIQMSLLKLSESVRWFYISYFTRIKAQSLLNVHNLLNFRIPR